MLSPATVDCISARFIVGIGTKIASGKIKAVTVEILTDAIDIQYDVLF